MAPRPIGSVDDATTRSLHFYRRLNDPAGASGVTWSSRSRGRGEACRRPAPHVQLLGALAAHRRTSVVTGQRPGLATRAARPAGVRSVSCRVADTVGFPSTGASWRFANRPSPADPGRVLATAARTAAPTGTPRLVAVPRALNDPRINRCLFRNAAAFGVAGVLLDADVCEPALRRSVRGFGPDTSCIFRSPGSRRGRTGIHQLRPPALLSADLGTTCRCRRWVVHHKSRGAGLPASRPRTASASALLLGAEGPGLSAAALGSGRHDGLPSDGGGVDSLNVQPAAAVAFFALANR